MSLPEIKNGELVELFAKIEALESKVKEQEKRLELITVQELRPIPGSFNVFKVAKLPTGVRPNSMYLVGDVNSLKFDIYVTGVKGEIYSHNKNSDEKQHVVVARTLELSDPMAVKRWLAEARCIAADIAEYLKATNVGSTARDIELEKRNSISQLLDATTKELEEISAAAERRLRELEQTKNAHNSTSGIYKTKNRPLMSDIVAKTKMLFMTIQDSDGVIDNKIINNYNVKIQDMFLEVEREVVNRTQEAIKYFTHAGFNLKISLAPIPNMVPMCTRLIQVSKEGRGLSLAFHDSMPFTPNQQN